MSATLELSFFLKERFVGLGGADLTVDIDGLNPFVSVSVMSGNN